MIFFLNKDITKKAHGIESGKTNLACLQKLKKQLQMMKQTEEKEQMLFKRKQILVLNFNILLLTLTLKIEMHFIRN